MQKTTMLSKCSRAFTETCSVGEVQCPIKLRQTSSEVSNEKLDGWKTIFLGPGLFSGHSCQFEGVISGPWNNSKSHCLKMAFYGPMAYGEHFPRVAGLPDSPGSSRQPVNSVRMGRATSPPWGFIKDHTSMKPRIALKRSAEVEWKLPPSVISLIRKEDHPSRQVLPNGLHGVFLRGWS